MWTTPPRQRRPARRGLRALSAAAAASAIVAVGSPALAQTQATARPAGPAAATAPGAAYQTALQYAVTFYPRWFTYTQTQLASIGGGNQLTGPDRMSPVFGFVVAPNDDTLYASGFFDLSAEPMILTIPPADVTYSVLAMDAYGTAFRNNLGVHDAGTYALIGPGWTGPLPEGVIRVHVPDVFSVWIIRADKFSGGTDQTAAAEQFRTHLRAEPLSRYRTHPMDGATQLLPIAAYAPRFKVAADTEIAAAPITFLRQLQAAVAAPTTPPLSPADQALSDRFNRLFHQGNLSPSARAQFAAGAQAAHTLIVDHYLTHHGPTGWVSFTDIADWGRHYLDRASTTQYLQYSNVRGTAAYYHAFTDAAGAQLTGNSPGYLLRFAKNQIPAAQRFWSLTAYTPDAITLIPNTASKYVVASYTPGLQVSPDGSISVYMTIRPPSGVPQANWLPVPPGPFNVVLRVYGPQGKVAHDTYVPPAITARP